MNLIRQSDVDGCVGMAFSLNEEESEHIASVSGYKREELGNITLNFMIQGELLDCVQVLSDKFDSNFDLTLDELDNDEMIEEVETDYLLIVIQEIGKVVKKYNVGITSIYDGYDIACVTHGDVNLSIDTDIDCSSRVLIGDKVKRP